MKKERHTITPAAYLVLIKENKILLQRRFNTGYEDGNYSLIAGHVESEETFTDAIIREAKEEANIDLFREDLQVIHSMHRKCPDHERIDIFLSANKWQNEIKNLEPNKCDELSWFNLDNLPDNIIPCIKCAIEKIQNKIHYSEHGWDL